jgi:hypothetical protein
MSPFVTLTHDRQGSMRTVIHIIPMIEGMTIQCVLYRTHVRFYGSRGSNSQKTRLRSRICSAIVTAEQELRFSRGSSIHRFGRQILFFVPALRYTE